MNFKKAIAFALVFTLLVSASSVFTSAFAAEIVAVPISAPVAVTTEGTEPEKTNTIIINGEPVVVYALNSLGLVMQYGTVTVAGEGDEARVVLMGVNDDGEQYAKIILNRNDNTLIINAVTGMPVAFEDIKEDEVAYAYVSPVMALSMPPQAMAEVILVGIPADYAVPSYVEIETVTVNDDATVTVVTSDGKTVVITEETALSPYLTRQVVTAEMLRPGQKLLVWFETDVRNNTVTTTANKVIAFNFSYQGSIFIDADGVVYLNGEAVRFDRMAMPYVDGETYMLPFRKMVESIGYTVTWDDETKSVTVSRDDEVVYSFAAGDGIVTMADGTERVLTKNFDGDAGVIFASVDDIVFLHNMKFVR